jgi:hypothetical protein
MKCEESSMKDEVWPTKNQSVMDKKLGSSYVGEFMVLTRSKGIRGFKEFLDIVVEGGVFLWIS